MREAVRIADVAGMSVLLAFVSGIASIMAYALLIGGVYRLFTIANDVSEIKRLLRDLKWQHDIGSDQRSQAPAGAPWLDPTVLNKE
jgi:hypothetical protein